MLLVDSNEPESIVKLLRQSCPVTVTNLNQAKMSDYWFANYEGKRLQFSRKQAAELVGNIDEAEDQLRDYYQQADENFQIVEGINSPMPIAIPTEKQLFGIKSGKLNWIAKHSVSTRTADEFHPASPPPDTRLSYAYKVEPITDKFGSTRYAITHGHTFNTPMSLIYAWIHRLAQCGIVTYWTINWVETAKLLSILYRNEQKPPEEHSTLQRVIRPRITIREADPFMKSLLFLSSAYQLGIGEVKAKALADRFCNILDIATASTSELTDVEGIGKGIAEKILRSLGRDLK